MTTVKQLLARKGDTVWSIAPDATVLEALAKMAEKDIGSLVVLDDEKQFVGILTERGYARNIALKGRTSAETSVKEIMETNAACVGSTQMVEECMALMTERRTRHLPVIDDGKVIGIVSIGDLVKDTISDQKFVIEQLERYVHS